MTTKYAAGIAALALTGCHHNLVKIAGLPSAVDSAVTHQVVNAQNGGDGDYQLQTLRARLDANTGDITARLEIAERYQTLGFTEIALDHARLLIEKAPDSEDARIALARFLRDGDRSTEAERGLTTFAEKHDASARLWAWVGLLRDDLGRWKDGETAHRKALALAPDHDDLHNNLGYCLLQQGRRDEAAAEFNAALRLNPHSVIARNNLGTSLSASAKEAVVHLQSVTDPASAHNNLATALMEAGRYDEARQELVVALGYNRLHSAVLENLELLSRMDGGSTELKLTVPARRTWAARTVSAWHRFWGVAPRNHENEGNAIGNGQAVTARK